MQRGGGKSQTTHGLPGDAEEKRGERAASAESRIPQPSPPGSLRGPTPLVVQTPSRSLWAKVRRGGVERGGQGRAGQGLGREETKELSAPDRARACCTSGIWDSPSAPSSPPLGPRVWAWRQIRICRESGWLRVNRRDELSQRARCSYCVPEAVFVPSSCCAQKLHHLFGYTLKLEKNRVYCSISS